MKSSSSSASSHHATSVSGGTSGPGAIQKAWAKFTKYTGRLNLKSAFAKSRRQRGNESPGFVVVRNKPLPIPAALHDPDMNVLQEDEDGRPHTPLKGHKETDSQEIEAEFPGPHGSEYLQKSSSSTSIASSSFSDSHWSRTSTLCSATSSPLLPVTPPERKPRRQVRFKLAEDDPAEEDSPPIPSAETIPLTPSNHSRIVQPIQFHPLLAGPYPYCARIVYDVSYLPSSWVVLDRSTNSSIPVHLLQQASTNPPVPITGELVLHSELFPWPVIVGPSSAACVRIQPMIGSGDRYYTGWSGPVPSRRRKSDSITNLDVLCALYQTLQVPVTNVEWGSLGHGSPLQRNVADAYERRCTRNCGGWEGGVRRVDWLGTRTTMIGVEVSAGTQMGRLIFF